MEGEGKDIGSVISDGSNVGGGSLAGGKGYQIE